MTQCKIPVKFDFYLGVIVYGVILFGKSLPLGTASVLCYLLLLFSLLKHVRLSNISVLLFLFFCLLVFFQLYVSITNSVDDFSMIITDANYYLSGFVLCLYVINNYNSDEYKRNKFLQGVILVSTIASITAIINYFTTHILSYDFIAELRVIGGYRQQWTYRLIGWASNPNNWAYMLGFPLVFSLYFSMLYGKLIYFIASVSMFLAIIFTASRGVIAPLVMVMVYFFLVSLFSTVKYKKFTLLVSFVVPLFAFALLAIYLNQSDRFVELFDRLTISNGVASNQDRGLIWLNYFDYFSRNIDSLLFGAGHGNFLIVPPDNSYIRITYTFGILIFMLALLLLLAYVASSWRKMNSLSKAMLGYLLFSSFFNDWVVTKTFWITLAFIVVYYPFQVSDITRFKIANRNQI